MKIRTRFPKLHPDKTIYAFCDESSQTAHRYFGVGALYFIPAEPDKGEELCQRIERELSKKKEEYGLANHELKWERVPRPGQYLDGYKNLIGFHLDNDRIYFRCMIVDTYEYSLSDLKFMEGDKELGYRKFLCVFLADGLMKSKQEYFFKIKIDMKGTRPQYSLEDLEQATNSRFIKRSSFEGEKCLEYCKIEEAKSKDLCILQVADILLGAVVAKWNEKVRAKGKLEMIDYIEQKLGQDLLTPTPPWNDRFNIWRFQVGE